MEVKIIEIEGKEFYAFVSDYFENEAVAETSGYYWDDELELWIKEIVNNQTTVF